MTSRSLVILDEIGRGTSTYDGLSLAWAITEHLADDGGLRPRAIFATHYHELTELADRLPGLVNLQLQVREWEGRIIFLHRVAPGRSDKSYGIHVARLAGVPEPVLLRAEEVLAGLTDAAARRLITDDPAAAGGSLAADRSPRTDGPDRPSGPAAGQLDLFGGADQAPAPPSRCSSPSPGGRS
jgi:DNA mismatch repair protein MutS